MEKDRVVKISAISYFISFFLFFALIIIYISLDFTDPFYTVLIQGNKLFENQLSLLSIYVYLDTLLIISWLIGWIGISVILQKRLVKFRIIIVISGFCGPLLDIIENEISWILISQYQNDKVISSEWIVTWELIQRLSYLLPYLSTILLGLYIKPRTLYEKYFCIFLVIGTTFSLTGLYFSQLYIYSQIWWPIYFLLSGFFLINNPAARSNGV